MLYKNVSGVETSIKLNNNIFYQLMYIVVIILSLLPLAFFIWANQKGFGITDEGFYLLSSQYPSEVKIWPSMAHIYTAWMYYLVGQNIIFLRAFGELLLLGSAFIFFLGWYRLVILFYPQLRSTFDIQMMAWSSISLGSMLFYVYFLFTPQYNLLNAIALNAATGFLCLGLSNLSAPPIKLKFALVYLFTAGLFIGTTLIIKFPTAITLTILYSFVLFLWPTLSNRSRFLSISVLGLGIFTWILFHIIYFQSGYLLWHGIYDGIAAGIFAARGYGMLSNLLRYFTESLHLMINVVQTFWGIYLILIFGLLLAHKAFKDDSTKLFSRFFIVLFFLVGCYCFKLKFYKGGLINHFNLTNFYVTWLLLLTISLFFNIFYHKKLIENWESITAKRVFLLYMFFLALPFAAIIGTLNPITIGLINNITPWMGLIQFLLISLYFSYNNRWIFLIGTFIISTFACTQIISSFLNPYNLHTGVLHQTVSTPIGFPPTYLKIDQASSNFFNQMYQFALSQGYKPGDDILAFSNMPGIIFALGGKSPVIPWYMAYPNAKKINEWFLDHTAPQRIKKAFILQNNSGEEGFPNLSKYGIKFPEDYILCGELVWPLTGEWVRLWKPKISA